MSGEDSFRLFTGLLLLADFTFFERKFPWLLLWFLVKLSRGQTGISPLGQSLLELYGCPAAWPGSSDQKPRPGIPDHGIGDFWISFF